MDQYIAAMGLDAQVLARSASWELARRETVNQPGIREHIATVPPGLYRLTTEVIEGRGKQKITWDQAGWMGVYAGDVQLSNSWRPLGKSLFLVLGSGEFSVFFQSVKWILKSEVEIHRFIGEIPNRDDLPALPGVTAAGGGWFTSVLGSSDE